MAILEWKYSVKGFEANWNYYQQLTENAQLPVFRSSAKQRLRVSAASTLLAVIL